VDEKARTALTCINDGVYGSDFSEDGLRLTLLRSPAYSCHPHDSRLLTPPQNRFTPHIDQGQRVFSFWCNAGKTSQRLKRIDREALTKNERPFALSFNPPAAGTLPKPLAILSDDVVQITAVKKAQKGNAVIVRLFEPTGRKRSTELSLPCLGKKMKLSLGAFEIKTIKINLRTGKWIETDLMENKVRR